MGRGSAGSDGGGTRRRLAALAIDVSEVVAAVGMGDDVAGGQASSKTPATTRAAGRTHAHIHAQLAHFTF